jgi:type IV pilus assembly protein PilO
MAGAKSSAFRFDVNSAFERAQSQFRGLNANEPGTWPLLPKLLFWLLAAAMVVLAGYLLIIGTAADSLEAERNREPELKAQFRAKLAQAVNLNELRKQKLQVQEYVTQLEKQLPGKAEMDALLSDINQAGLGRGLLFELFRPGQVEIKEYHAELPIAIRVSGRYHDIGAFAADISNLSRIVTLQNLVISQVPGQRPTEAAGSGQLAMEATARTYRYLYATEIAAQQKAAAAARQQGAKK